MPIHPKDARWKFAGDDSVARQIREKLSEMSRELNRFAGHAEKRRMAFNQPGHETTQDQQMNKQWEKAVAALQAAEAAVDKARYEIYPLG